MWPRCSVDTPSLPLPVQRPAACLGCSSDGSLGPAATRETRSAPGFSLAQPWDLAATWGVNQQDGRSLFLSLCTIFPFKSKSSKSLNKRMSELRCPPCPGPDASSPPGLRQCPVPPADHTPALRPSDFLLLHQHRLASPGLGGPQLALPGLSCPFWTLAGRHGATDYRPRGSGPSSALLGLGV